MNKQQILAQIREQMETEKHGRDDIRDEAFYTALSKNPKLTRQEFNKTYSDSNSKNLSLKQRYTQTLIEQSKFKTNAPSNFNHPKPEQKNIYQQFENYCKKFPYDVQNLVLHGSTGTGKTYATHIIANYLLKRGFSVLYTTSFGLIERFKN